MIEIQNGSVLYRENAIIHIPSLKLEDGNIYALVAPNGAGKSSCAYALIGYPGYAIAGALFCDGVDVRDFSMVERAQKGWLLIFQQSPEIAGLSCFRFLKEAYHAVRGQVDILTLKKKIDEACDFVGLSRDMMQRELFVGFSGGQRKRFELVQAMVLQPSFLILDEVDAGMDQDGIAAIVRVVEFLQSTKPNIIILVISHNKQLLKSFVGLQVYVIEDKELKSGALEK
jgi:Fe-S cluster assembly ATP-binding protein